MPTYDAKGKGGCCYTDMLWTCTYSGSAVAGCSLCPDVPRWKNRVLGVAAESPSSNVIVRVLMLNASIAASIYARISVARTQHGFPVASMT